ncbi:response regulator [Jiella avicenniae]|uniref:Response regulator n=1 Tax=Jiella avicenniae TaxID=2907202 RepID=A0A9X1T7X4_9HYPH|nr:response regulator [Jiella avicenniae]MCE7030940.1 response regulator [Jiella avicenniae]
MTKSTKKLAEQIVLVAEDEMFIAQDIAFAIQDAGGAVVGPFSTVEEAMDHLGKEAVTAAILDVNLLDGDITPVLEHLVQLGRPVVVNTGTVRPWEMEQEFPAVPVFSKPTDPEILVRELSRQIQT